MHPAKIALLHLPKSRWLLIAVGIWIEICAGASYDFGVYSQSIKTALGYNQEQLDTVSFCKDLGANVGVLSGLLYDVLPTWTILALAAVHGFLGYFMMWLSIAKKIARPALWQMCIYMFLATNAQCYMSTAVVVTCVKTFPTRRGTVIGLMKGSMGLSGAMLVQLYRATYANDPKSFLLLISWLMAVICLSFMFIMQPLRAVESPKEKRWFDILSGNELILGFYMLGMIILQNNVTVGKSWAICIFIVAVVFLLLPLFVVVKTQTDIQESALDFRETDPLLNETNNTPENLPGFESCSEAAQQPAMLGLQTNLVESATRFPQQSSTFSASSQNDNVTVNAKQESNNHGWKMLSRPKIGENFTLFQAARTLDFWMLFCGTACSMGSGLTTINNMSQMGSSLGYADREITALISLWSIWNFLGRFGGGYVSEFFLQSKGTARPLFIAITIAAMGVGHLLIAAALPASLYVGSVLVGLGYGAQWSLMPATTSELFGLQHFGTLFNTISIASPLGSYILSVKVAGYLYDMESQNGQHARSGRSLWLISNVFNGYSCYGTHCFRLTFFILAGVCLLGLLTSTALFFRTRLFYLQVHGRLHHRTDCYS